MLAIADKLQQNAKLCNFVYIDWIWLKKNTTFMLREAMIYRKLRANASKAMYKRNRCFVLFF